METSNKTNIPAAPAKIPTLNVALLLRVKEAILAHNERFDMAIWVSRTVVDPQDGAIDYESVNTFGELAHNCDTVGCIAGWTVAIGSPTQEKYATLASEVAARLLGIPNSLRDTLFYTTAWPSLYEDEYERVNQSLTLTKAEKQKRYAEIAAARIDALIRTGE